MLPNFICIGAYRAGTTWFHSVLSKHPEVFVPAEKELMFFSRYYDRGIDWYRQFFENAGHKSIRAEICPTYLSYADTPQRINRHIPDVKLFACLRNPVDQIYSQYNLGLVRGKYTKPFDSLVRDQNFASLKHAFHAKHINNYLKYFDRSKLLILLYDDLVSDPQGFLKNVYTFLGVNEYYPEFPNRRVNYSREPRFAFLDRFIARVGKALRDSDLLRLKIALNRVGISNKLKKINSRRTTPKPLDPKVREYLNTLYAEDKKRLEILIDRDLSIWQ